MRVVVEPGSEASSSSVATEAQGPADIKSGSPSSARVTNNSNNSDTKGMRLRDLIFQASAAEPVLTSSKNSLFKKPVHTTTPSVKDGEREPRPIHPLAQPPTDNNHIVLQTEQEMMIAKAIASMDRGASSSSSSAAHIASGSGLASPSSNSDDQNNTGPNAGTAPWSSQIVRKRGRPRKVTPEDAAVSLSAETPTPKRQPGRPRKTVVVTADDSKKALKGDIPKSQYRGVSWDRRMGMWRAKANAVHIGFFPDEKEAAMAYDKAKLSLHKNSGNGNSNNNAGARGIGLNFPENHPGARQITKGEPRSDDDDEDEEGDEDGEEAGDDKEDDESAASDAPGSSAAFKPLSSSARSSAPLGDGDVYNQKQLTAGSYTVQATQQVIQLNNHAEPDNGPPTVTAAVRLNKKTADRPSRYRGVMWDYGTRSWRSKIKVKGKTWYLGVFADEEQAARAYDSAACFVSRDRSTLNFPQTDYSSIPLPRPPPSWVIAYVNELREQNATKKGAIAAAVGNDVAEQILTGVTQRYSAKRKYFQHQEDAEQDGEQEEQRDEDDDDGDEEMGVAGGGAANDDVKLFLGRAQRVGRDELEPSRLAMLQQQYLEMSSPLKMMGVTRVVDGDNNEKFEVKVDFQGHTLCVGSEFTTAGEACRAYDIAFLKLKGTGLKSELNCPAAMIPILLREPLPHKLEMLVKGLYPLTSLYHGRSKKEKSRAKASEVRQALTTVRDQYRRRKTTSTDISPAGAAAAESDAEDEPTSTKGETSTAGATLAQLSAQVRRISDSLREDDDDDVEDDENDSARRPKSKRVKPSPSAAASSTAGREIDVFAELADAARRAVEQAAKANTSLK